MTINQIFLSSFFTGVKYLRDNEGIRQFGLRVRSLRLSKNLTQESLAWEAGMEPMHISKIERGIINTSISHAFAIARALKVAPTELFIFE